MWRWRPRRPSQSHLPSHRFSFFRWTREMVPAPALHESEKSLDQLCYGSSQMKENKKSHQMKHTFAGSKNFFFSVHSAFTKFFVQIISSVQKLPPHEIWGPIIEGPWRSPDPSLLLPNWDAPPLSRHQLRCTGYNRKPQPVPTWFSHANSSTLAPFYLLNCTK